MSMNTRRRFLRGAGIFGTIVGGVATGKMIVEKHYQETKYIPAPEQPKQDISHLAPETPTTLMLQGNPKKREPSTLEGNGFLISHSNVEYQNKVEMSVGKDNRLWVKVNDEWKRVSIER